MAWADGWTATLRDGRQFTRESPELIGDRSPWREHERLAWEQGVTIARAEVCFGLRRVELEAEGGALVCGGAIDLERDLFGDGQRMRHYRWVCRQTPDSWLWRLTDGIGAWEIETTAGAPGEERMPLPPVERQTPHDPQPSEELCQA